MIRVLHFCLLRHLSKGIKNQLRAELNAVESLSEDCKWNVAAFSLDEVSESFMHQVKVKENGIFPFVLRQYIELRRQAYSWLLENQKNYDVILLRYRDSDLFLNKASYRLENYYTVHHSCEEHEIASHYGLVSFIQRKLERILASSTLRRAKGVIGVTNEIIEYELARFDSHNHSSFCYSNGIDVENVSCLDDFRSGKPKFIFISSAFYSWHGLDKVLEQVEKSDLDFELHIVGDLLDNKKIVDDRIFYHGVLEPSEIDIVMAKCDIGLAPFAMHRKNMKEAVSLKVRDYLAHGIPVFAGHIDSAIPQEFSYFVNNEFSFEEASRLAGQFRRIPREQIKQAAIPYIEKKVLVSRLLSFLRSEFKNQ